jgi:hypothetical protein
MRYLAVLTAVVVGLLCAAAARAASVPPTGPANFMATDSPAMRAVDPNLLDDSAGDEDNTVYGPPPLSPQQQEGINSGGANLDLSADYANAYVYRGVNHDDIPNPAGDSLNLLINGRLTFDFGQYPHLFVGIFSNVYDADPVSRFQEVMPSVGATWDLRPFLLEFGHNAYIYPQRENFDTSELYAKVTIDDSLLFNTDAPIFSPYAMASYDIADGKGWYVELGLSHDFPIADWGITLTVKADVAYIASLQQQFIFINTMQDTGWQHAEGGLYGSYNLNTLLNIPKRYGDFDLTGFIIYSGKLSKQITASDVLWGGGGIDFKY